VIVVELSTVIRRAFVRVSRVELFEKIRGDERRDGLSIRALSDKYGVHRRTVRQALEAAVPPERKTPVRVAPKMDSVKPLIDVMLRQDLDAPPKQRHTARRILNRLIDEHAVTDVCYSSVREYVALARPRIWAEAGRSTEQAYVPQTHEPGGEAEVDFGDLWVDLRGERTKLHLFTFRLSFSGLAVHRAFGTQSQESFLEGHVHAFDRVGGVPVEHVRYDNLKAAVSRVLFGRDRTESARWTTFRSHYGFDAFYCQPGIEGAHEKGGVEGEIGRFRRTHLVPVPRIDSVAELNERLAAYDATDDRRRIDGRVLNVGDSFALEAPMLRPLPGEDFETGLVATSRVDRYSRVTVRQCHYSVPARFIGRRLRTVLRASELLAFDGAGVVARHERALTRGQQVLLLDHYLEVLSRKPGALPGATALAQARSAGTFTPTHEAFWAAARRADGDGGGTRALVEVLLLHRHMHPEHVLAGMTAALKLGVLDPQVVAVEARKAARPTAAAVAGVVDLAARRLPTDTRSAPDLTPYDDLLTGTDQP
jgi:transposase